MSISSLRGVAAPAVACLVIGCSANSGASGPGGGGSAGTPSSGGASTTGGAGGNRATGGSTASLGERGGEPGTGGSTATGGSNPGTGGTAATGGAGGSVFVPPTCAPGSSTTLPSTAPLLQAGTWKDISPSQVLFKGDPGAGDPFTQGITLNPCNVATLYLAVVSFQPDKGDAGLYRSTDAGSSWVKLGQLDEPINVLVDPNDPLHLYVSDGVRGQTGGFWVSSDGGATFTQPDGFKTVSPSTDGYHVDADPADFNHVLFSYHSDWPGGANGVLESTDSGTTWTKHAIPGAGGCGCDVYFLSHPSLGIGNSKTWLYGSQGTGFWRTTDAGANWTHVSNNNMDHGGGAVYYTKAGVLYVTSSSHILRSTDNGVSFVERAPQAYYLSIIGDGTNLYTANHGGGAYVTAPENNDTNWTTYGSGQTFGEGPFGMAYDSANDILYAGNIRSGAWALRLH